MTTKQIGEISEAKVTARFLELGYPVLHPWGDNLRYDLVIDCNGEFITVQVKTAYKSKQSESIIFSCRSNNWNSKKTTTYKNDVDIFAVYYPENNSIYIIPVEDAPITTMTLRLEMSQNNQIVGINWAEDYQL